MSTNGFIAISSKGEFTTLPAMPEEETHICNYDFCDLLRTTFERPDIRNEDEHFYCLWSKYFVFIVIRGEDYRVDDDLHGEHYLERKPEDPRVDAFFNKWVQLDIEATECLEELRFQEIGGLLLFSTFHRKGDGLETPLMDAHFKSEEIAAWKKRFNGEDLPCLIDRKRPRVDSSSSSDESSIGDCDESCESEDDGPAVEEPAKKKARLVD